MATVVGNVVASSIRDAIRNYRQEVSNALYNSGITDPFATDSTESRSSCNYMDDLSQTPVDKIKKYTALPNDALAYYMNN